MSDTRRLLEAATSLSRVLSNHQIPHAFYGNFMAALLANSPQSNEIFCIVEGGQSLPHPFRRVRDAVAGSDDFTSTHSPWTNCLHVTYRNVIPAIQIGILPAGETGPRRLDSTALMKIQGIPFLSTSEFVRAKLKTWMIRGSQRDALDIVFVLTRYWNRVDLNRIPEQDMAQFVARNPAAAPAWAALRSKYGM